MAVEHTWPFRKEMLIADCDFGQSDEENSVWWKHLLRKSSRSYLTDSAKKNMEDENKTKQDLKCGHSLWRQMEERLAAPCKQTAPQRLSARLEKNTEKLDDHGSFSLHLLCKKWYCSCAAGQYWDPLVSTMYFGNVHCNTEGEATKLWSAMPLDGWRVKLCKMSSWKRSRWQNKSNVPHLKSKSCSLRKNYLFNRTCTRQVGHPLRKWWGNQTCFRFRTPREMQTRQFFFQCLWEIKAWKLSEVVPSSTKMHPSKVFWKRIRHALRNSSGY